MLAPGVGLRDRTRILRIPSRLRFPLRAVDGPLGDGAILEMSDGADSSLMTARKMRIKTWLQMVPEKDRPRDDDSYESIFS